jgi:hypothetical protein
VSVQSLGEARQARYARAISALREGLEAGAPDVRARLQLIVMHQRLARASAPAAAQDAIAVDALERRPGAERVADYGGLVKRIQARVEETLPLDATVLVISRGDTVLLNIKGRSAGHFPQNDAGEWAGFYPPDSQSAIAHLEQLRTAGAEFLVVPATSAWWLDYYDRLARHLLTRAFVVHHDDDCAIFDLRRDVEGSPPQS